MALYVTNYFLASKEFANNREKIGFFRIRAEKAIDKKNQHNAYYFFPSWKDGTLTQGIACLVP